LDINGKEIEQVNALLYLGNIITCDGRAIEEVKSHIRRGNGAFVQMCPVWKPKIFPERPTQTFQQQCEICALVWLRHLENYLIDTWTFANLCL
jgi:hypothetical protein